MKNYLHEKGYLIFISMNSGFGAKIVDLRSTLIGDAGGEYKEPFLFFFLDIVLYEIIASIFGKNHNFLNILSW